MHGSEHENIIGRCAFLEFEKKNHFRKVRKWSRHGGKYSQCFKVVYECKIFI